MPNTAVTRGAGLALVLGALAACTTPYDPPVLAARPPGSEAFKGLLDLAAESKGQVLDVVIVHGMCTHGQQWASDALGALSSMLGGPKVPPQSVEPVAGTQAVLHRADLPAGKGRVRATAIVWSPIVAPLKAQLCYDQSSKSELCAKAPPYPYERASLNRQFKDTLLNDCLADAMIYQGRSRNEVNRQMQRALLAAATGADEQARAANIGAAAAAASNPLVLVTESLGSKVAFDALYRLATHGDVSTAAAGQRTLARTAQVFMGANQLPILALADQQLGTGAAGAAAAAAAAPPAYPQDPLGALMQLRRSADPGLAASTAPAFKVVAFTDPNDLLSYTLVPAAQPTGVDVVDVVVSNTATLAGLLERPDVAHKAYLANKAVTRLIVHGHR